MTTEKLKGVNIPGKLVPNTSADTYATHDSAYGKGGLKSVNTVAERDAISQERRTAGMFVFVVEENQIYTLGVGLSNNDWFKYDSKFYNKNEVDTLLDTKADKSNTYTKKEVDDKLIGLYRFKGSVETYEDLPKEGNEVGDVWNVVQAHTTDPKFEAGSNLAWTGTDWDVLGGMAVDLKDYAKKVYVDEKVVEEATVRETADNTLTANLNVEIERAKGVENTLTTGLANEISSRVSGDTEINNKLGTGFDASNTVRKAIDTNATAVVTEKTRAETAETTLQTNIDNETTRATTAETNLTNYVNEELAKKEPLDDHSVRYQDFEKSGQIRKTIQLSNYDNISGIDTTGVGHNLIMVSQWDVADVGAVGLHMNLNTKDAVTVNDSDVALTDKLIDMVVTAKDNTVTVESSTQEISGLNVKYLKLSAKQYDDTEVRGLISTEALTRQTADSALQANIDFQKTHVINVEDYGFNSNFRINKHQVLENSNFVEDVLKDINDYKRSPLIICGDYKYSVMGVVVDSNNLYKGFACEGLFNEPSELLTNGNFYEERVIFLKENTGLTTHSFYTNTKDLDLNTKLIAGSGIDLEIDADGRITIVNTDSEGTVKDLKLRVEKLESYVQTGTTSTNQLVNKAYVDNLLNDEATARSNADDVLQNNISTEEARATEIENDINARIGNGFDYTNTVAKTINDEKNRAELAEQTNANNISAEALVRENADNSLDTKFTGLLGTGFSTTNTVRKSIDQTLVDAKAYTDERVAGAYKFKGSVETYEDLLAIEEKEVGDVYNVIKEHKTEPKFNAGSNFAWNGIEWDLLGGTIDLSNYYTKEETAGLVSIEATARADADTVLTNTFGDLFSESNTVSATLGNRFSKDLSVSTALTTEEQTRLAKDNELNTAITTEASTRETKDNELKSYVDTELAKKETLDDYTVRYQDFEYSGEVRKTIQLANHNSISGIATTGTGHNLIMLSKWDVADVGAVGVHLNLNTKDAVTVNDSDVALTDKLIDTVITAKDDTVTIESATQEISGLNVKYLKFSAKQYDDTEVRGLISTETSARVSADNTLQENIDFQKTHEINVETYGFNTNFRVNTHQVLDNNSFVEDVLADINTHKRVPVIVCGDYKYSVVGLVVDSNNLYKGIACVGLFNDPASMVANGNFYEERVIFLKDITTTKTHSFYTNTKDLDLNTKLVAGDGISLSVGTDGKITITNTDSQGTVKDLKLRVEKLESYVQTGTSSTNQLVNKSYVDGKVSDEETARTNADNTLQDNIDTEASTRATKDTELNTAITTESTTRATEDTRILGESKGYTDAEILSLKNNEIATLQGQVATLTSQLADITTKVNKLMAQMAALKVDFNVETNEITLSGKDAEPTV